ALTDCARELLVARCCGDGGKVGRVNSCDIRFVKEKTTAQARIMATDAAQYAQLPGSIGELRRRRYGKMLRLQCPVGAQLLASDQPHSCRCNQQKKDQCTNDVAGP